MEMPGRNGYAVQGGWANSNSMINGQTYPADLSINNRTNNTPPEYTAANSVSFVGEYEDGSGDEYMAYILDANNASSSTSSAGSGSTNSGGFRYGFNGKEKDNDMDGNNYDYGFRIYNPGLGRFLSVDPLQKQYPYYTPYQFSGNSPIIFIDLDGKEPAKPIAPNAKTVLIVPQSAGTDGYTFNSAYNAALKNPNIDVIKVSSVTQLNKELKATTKQYDNLIICDHAGVSREATATGTPGQKIGNYTYNKTNVEAYKDDFKGVGESVKENGSIVLLGCMTAAPQYQGADYVKTVAKETNRKVFADQGETFIGPHLFDNNPLGGTPNQSDNQVYYYPIAQENASKWTLALPSGATNEVGNLKLDNQGNPSTTKKLNNTNTTNNTKKNEKKPQPAPPPSN